MYCKNLLIRKRKYKPYFYCKEFKKEIILPCDKNCLEFNLVRNKGIKNKSIKQKKLEDKRFSIFTNNLKKCYYCQKENVRIDLHEVWGGSNRKRSILNGFVIPLCRNCHKNEEIINYLKKKLQLEYEKTHSRDDFIRLIGKSKII